MAFNYEYDRQQSEVAMAVVFAGLAGLGAWLHSTVLALFGVLGALSAITLYVWQRGCLNRLEYRRSLPVERAHFGEELHLESELVNDKLLPLPWVKVSDEVPPYLSIAGTSTDPERPGTRQLVQVFAMLPYQKTRRTVTVVCDHRGRHVFGASEVASGDPLGVLQKQKTVEGRDELVVYPKVFEVLAPALASLTPLGDDRAARMLIGDPTRVAGMRAYRAGDPLRHVDWRATARSGELLVRDFEPTTTLRLIIFIDLAGPPGELGDEVMEFTIAIGASIASAVAGAGFATGLFAPGTADGRPVAHDPSSAPGALAGMLELLALCTPEPGHSLAQVMLGESSRIRRGTSVVVVSSQFTPGVVAAVAECKRRARVSAVGITHGAFVPPPLGVFDSLTTVSYARGWQQRDSVDFAAA